MGLKDQNLDEIVNEITDFYNIIKKDFRFKWDDIVVVRDLIDGLQLLPYEELTNDDDLEEEKVKRPTIPQNIKTKYGIEMVENVFNVVQMKI